MDSKEYLEKTIRVVKGQRERDYGNKKQNHENIAKLWSAYLDKEITPHDVAICMGLVKVARLKHARKKDSYVDLAAYAAIAGEIDERTND